MNLIKSFNPIAVKDKLSLQVSLVQKKKMKGTSPQLGGLLDIQAQGDIMNLIKSFDSNNLKDGTFTSGVSLQLST